mmetsp:Transcript_10656/g.22749  ORF Transcript_10656/g.22749 Transcript_10656/m.22749 type:complete len:93 (-) Transcript_10656:180-458(-)
MLPLPIPRSKPPGNELLRCRGNDRNSKVVEAVIGIEFEIEFESNRCPVGAIAIIVAEPPLSVAICMQEGGVSHGVSIAIAIGVVIDIPTERE